MSTRSGKRIHGSLYENIGKTDVGLAPKSERKTRSKLMKENVPDPSTILQKFKKRENYVSYPTDDELVDDTVNLNENGSTRTLRKNALQEFNPPVVTTETFECEVPPKTVRSTRRTRKFVEIAAGDIENVEIKVNSSGTFQKETKKSKRKKISCESAEAQQKTEKKKNKKKCKRSNSFAAENGTGDVIVDINIVNINNSIASNDSFHSAAGSPVHENVITQAGDAQLNSDEIVQPKKSNRKTKKAQLKCQSIENLISKDNEISENKNDTFDIVNPSKKSSIKAGIDQTDNETRISKSNENIFDTVVSHKNNTFEMEQETGKKKKSSIERIGLNDSVIKIRKSDANVFIPKDNEKKNETIEILPKTGNLKKSSINPASFDASVTKIRMSDENISISKDDQNKNDTFDIEPRKSSAQNESVPKLINTTFERETVSSASKSKKRKSTMDNISIKTITSTDIQTEKIPSLNSTYDKAETSIQLNSTDFDNLNSSNKKKKSTLDITFEKETVSPKVKSQKSGNVINVDRKSKDATKSPVSRSLDVAFEAMTKVTENLNNTFDKSEKFNTTVDKNQNSTFDKISKSLISSDSSNDDTRISITSDESMTEPIKKPVTIMNTTPVFIDSSIEESLISEESQTEVTPLRREGTFSLEDSKSDIIPLKREGTFTKDGPDDPYVNKETPPATPQKNVTLPSPGCTPHPTKSSTKKPLLNVTRSIEKTSILEPAPRITKVMFCSPVNNPVVAAQQKRTVIKSNLKGSNKSFVYEEIADTPPVPPSGRKRSYTHSEADEEHVKRKRLTDDIRQSVDRLSRPRTSSANAKLDSTPSKKSTTPSKAKVSRTKLPNFAALHQKQFDKMESLDECQERRAKRARQLLTPTHVVNLDKSSTKVPESPKVVAKKVDTLAKSFSQEATKSKYTRFGFKLNMDVNPFSIPSQNPKKNTNVLKRQVTLPSLTGATSVRREVAKQVVMREKSFSDKRSLKRNENRTIIKGVRTNRRFELQMKLRNME